MKALIYTGSEATEIRDWDEPVLLDGDVLVDLAFCGICGSDMHAWHGHDPRRVPPMILGHEAVGTIANGPRTGERVAINPLVACGTCALCKAGKSHLCETRTLLGMGRPGGFAERIAVNADMCVPLRDSTAWDRAALTEPLACITHAMTLTQFTPETRVTVLGGGAIGLLAAKAYRAKGVHEVRIAETNPLRRAMLTAPGILPYDPISDPAAPSSVDLVFDAVGTGRTRAAASEMVMPGGAIIHIGLQDSLEGLDTRRITLQEILFTGTYCYKMDDFKEALRLLEEDIITGDGWTEIRPLDAGPQSFADIDTGKAPPKILLEI